jgi:hypothetical protein
MINGHVYASFALYIIFQWAVIIEITFNMILITPHYVDIK